MIHEPPKQIIEGATPLRAAVQPWTKEKSDRLTELWGNKGITSRMICKELGYTRNAVIAKAKRLGLQQLQPRRTPITPWSQRDCLDVVELWKQQLSLGEIADRMGRSSYSVRGKLREFGHKRDSTWNRRFIKPCRKGEWGLKIPQAPKTIVSNDTSWRALESAWVPLPNATPIEFMEHTHRTCHWPIGDEYPFKWCGALRIKGCSYCQSHHDMAVRVVEG